MFDEELYRMIMVNQTHTICETCDTVFKYIPQKVFCNECNAEKKRVLNKKRSRKYNPKNAEACRRYRKRKKEMI